MRPLKLAAALLIVAASLWLLGQAPSPQVMYVMLPQDESGSGGGCVEVPIESKEASAGQWKAAVGVLGLFVAPAVLFIGRKKPQPD